MSVTRPYRGSSAETRRLERRERLLDAARQIFGVRGFHASTVRSICEEAGLTERYFYESFENSEALFIAMHRRTSDHILTEITIAGDRCAGGATEKLNAILIAYYEDIRRDPVSARLFAVDAGYISPEAKHVCASWRATFGLLLSRTLNAGGQPPDPILRSAVVRALLGIGVDWMEDSFSTPLTQVVQAGTTIALALKDQ